MASENNPLTHNRPEVMIAFFNLRNVLEKSKLFERSKEWDKWRTNDYWSTIREMGARTFEQYVKDKLREKGVSNDFLVNLISIESDDNVYLNKDEKAEIYEAYDKLFDTLQTRETDKGVELYQGGEIIDKTDSIENRTDKSKYLTDNEVKEVAKDSENFVNKIDAMEKGKLSQREQIVVLTKLPSPYNNIPELKGRKLLITQDIYKKIGTLPNKYKKNHNVVRERTIKIPELVADPNYILQSTAKGHEDRFVVVTKSRGKKPAERLSIIIQPDTDAAVVSGYDEIINISDEKKENRVLYDKKKELEAKSPALNAGDTSNSSVNNITQSSGRVNSKKVKQGVKGSFTASKGLIQLTQNADYSTLPHEFAHYWLNNMWNYVRSGAASEKYQNRWKVIADWLGIKPTQTRIYRNQQEQFARGYEAYLLRGDLPTPIIASAFDDYDKCEMLCS